MHLKVYPALKVQSYGRLSQQKWGNWRQRKQTWATFIRLSSLSGLESNYNLYVFLNSLEIIRKFLLKNQRVSDVNGLHISGYFCLFLVKWIFSIKTSFFKKQKRLWFSWNKKKWNQPKKNLGIRNLQGVPENIKLKDFFTYFMRP